jgi:phosphatidylglycerophosphatase C
MGIFSKEQRGDGQVSSGNGLSSPPNANPYAPWPNPSTPPQTLVAFDFDGTLTVRDSFIAFLAWRAGAAGFLLGMARLSPHALAYLVHRDRGKLKAAALGVFLKGLDKLALEASATAFARAAAPKLFRPDALAAWHGWKSQGAHRVIVTASPEILIAPFAKHLGAEGLIGTQIGFDSLGQVTGKLSSENCRADEKVKRLEAVFGQDLVLTAAYGDTSGDTQMLARAKAKGYRVFRQKP